MPYLTKSLKAWEKDEFKSVFIEEVAELSLRELPLQQALQTGSYATKDNLQIMINSVSEQTDSISINTGIFFSSTIAGCNCSDDPTPVDLNSEYCELSFKIDKSGAQTEISIL